MPAYFKGTEKNLKITVGISCHKNTKFLDTKAEVFSVSHTKNGKVMCISSLTLQLENLRPEFRNL
jgi:hypothetical protein